MISSTVRKFLFVGGAVALLLVLLLVAPALFNLNSFKPELIARVKQETGRDLVLDGPINLSLLPTPRVEVHGVKVSNMAGAKDPDMVEVERVTVEPSLLALLKSEENIERMTRTVPLERLGTPADIAEIGIALRKVRAAVDGLNGSISGSSSEPGE